MPASLLAATLLAIGAPADWTPLSFRNIPPIRHQIEGKPSPSMSKNPQAASSAPYPQAPA